uniref:Proton-activated chloride channel n=1 Tax=Oryzias latipes TaxID=8090 RepID=A0A3P9M1B8_ORYLA
MPGHRQPRLYQSLNNVIDEEEEDEGNTPSQDSFDDVTREEGPQEPGRSSLPEEEGLKDSRSPRRITIFLAYQTISDFLEKLSQPVMSVTYKEVDSFSPPGVALFPGNAQLLSCKHHYHDYIPALVNPGKPQPGDCEFRNVTYVGPFSNGTQKHAVVVRGPSDVRNKELIFMQFSLNETQEDFSAITYMLFARFSDLTASEDKSEFMRDCERNYSTWTFSGGFRTWVKMSLVNTAGKNNQGVEFRQESSVVKFNDKRQESEQTNQLFFVVFEWRDPYIQEIRLVVTANPWSSIAILCGVFMALFKAANFAKLTIQWIIRMRKRHLKHKSRELNSINRSGSHF